MKVLKHSSNITLLNNVSCGLETTGDLCLILGGGRGGYIRWGWRGSKEAGCVWDGADI